MSFPVYIDPDRRLYILHPRLSDSTRYIASFIESPSVLYVGLRDVSLSSADVRTVIQTACDEQIASRQLSDVTMLILDKGDYTSETVLIDVLQWLLVECKVERVVLISRHVSSRLFDHQELQPHIQLMPVDERRMLHDYTTLTAKDVHLLEVQALGSGRVYLDGEEIDMQTGGSLPQKLFFFLIDRRMATRDEIFQNLWAEQTTREATNVFHVTKRKISEILGLSVTEYIGGYYRISSAFDVRYDVELFRRHIQKAALCDSDEAIEVIETALDVYRYHFLSGMSGTDWVIDRRDELGELRAGALVDLAGYYMEQGNTDKALGIYTQALRHNMSREDIVLAIMQLYLQANQPHDALKAYNRTRDLLLDTLGVEPGRQLQELADQAMLQRDKRNGKT